MFARICTGLAELVHPSGTFISDARKALELGDPVIIEFQDKDRSPEIFSRIKLPSLGNLIVESGTGACSGAWDSWPTLRIIDPAQSPKREQSVEGVEGRLIFQSTGLVAARFRELVKSRLRALKSAIQ